MKEYLFTGIMGALALVSTIIISKGGLHDKKYKWYRRIKHRGWVVIFIGGLIIGLSIWQAFSINEKNRLNESNLIRLKKKSDSIVASEIKIGVDESRRKLFSDLSLALATQQLSLDTVNKTVKSLRDSTKTVIINPEKKVPELVIVTDGIIEEEKSDDLIKLQVNFTSWNASLKILGIYAFEEFVYKNGYIDTVERGLFYSNGSTISANTYFGKSLKYTKQYVTKQIDYINFAFWGTYAALDDDTPIKLKVVYRYNVYDKTAKLFEPLPTERFYKKYNINF